MEDLLLKKYTDYLDSLLKDNSGETFTNGGREYASQLMSRLFDHTQKEARIYCKGFRGDLICEKPYWESLNRYLADPKKKIMVLVESNEYMNDRPIQLLKTVRESRGDDSVELRQIQEDDRKNIENSLSDHDCNFAVFDDSMFRFEYDPDGFKAFGSFNAPDKCSVLKQVFDGAFRQATPLFVD